MLDQPRTKYPKRTSLMELRPHHLNIVELLARRRHYERVSQHDFMLENWNRIFGALRPKAKAVSSDQLRKSLMLHRLLDMVDARRAEIGILC
jgi:hypothetical protein